MNFHEIAHFHDLNVENKSLLKNWGFWTPKKNSDFSNFQGFWYLLANKFANRELIYQF